jgi:CDP-6-deoxy-D-xylo-4-hexulose-3-dehydrase
MPVSEPKPFSWPLMHNNITRADLQCVVEFLQKDEPILTQSEQVREFEREWSQWLGVRHSVFVNSGSSANLITLAALRERFGPGEVIVPSLTWVSDIASVLQAGFHPVFVDSHPKTLGMDLDEVVRKITPHTRAVFLTHVLGFRAFTLPWIEELRRRNVWLIEDASESHGAALGNQKIGTFGYASNFSFYYAHHLSTVEGGMVCTDDTDFFELLRMFRSHGLVRECASDERKKRYHQEFPDLHPDFIFGFPAYNVRNTEINAVIGRNQLKRLDHNIARRNENFKLFLDNLDPEIYRTDFELAGSSNYAFTLILQQPDPVLCGKVVQALTQNRIEFRRGTAGGGNQLRQPYLRRLLGADAWKSFPQTEHIHFFGFYIGNYPDLTPTQILHLCSILNSLAHSRPSSAKFE